MTQASIGSPALWLGFLFFVLAMLALDLGVFHRRSHEVGVKEAAVWSGVWIALALVFNLGVYFWFGADRALEFAAGYVIEKALAVDNIFVFVVIFGTFAVPAAYQHRVLFWGVLGALVMRATFIFAGAALLERFHWAIYLFGGILVVTGVKLLLQRHHEVRPERNPAVRVLQRILPITSEYAGDKFVVWRQGRRFATPLLVALVAVEVTDVVFAVDSIPAIFAVTMDPFIVFTSNVFAILGLRSLYFVLAGIIRKFVYLKIGLAVVLLFVGAKMSLLDVVKVPIGASLAIIAAILGISVIASLGRRPPRRDGDGEAATRETVAVGAPREIPGA
jgi:tellurite resistance protein TerC